jgi:hypothetical protein
MMARDRELLALPSIVLILHFAVVRLVKVFGNRCARNQGVALRTARSCLSRASLMVAGVTGLQS